MVEKFEKLPVEVRWKAYAHLALLYCQKMAVDHADDDVTVVKQVGVAVSDALNRIDARLDQNIPLD